MSKNCQLSTFLGLAITSTVRASTAEGNYLTKITTSDEVSATEQSFKTSSVHTATTAAENIHSDLMTSASSRLVTTKGSEEVSTRIIPTETGNTSSIFRGKWTN